VNNNNKGLKEIGEQVNSNSYKDYNAKYQELDKKNKNTQGHTSTYYHQPASNSF
jgi:hypothetical protein